MIPTGVYSTLPADFNARLLPALTEPRRVLLCSPEHFDVVDVKNVYMEGQGGRIDRTAAISQWDALRACYERLQAEGMLDEVAVLPGAADCEDMVFAANQSFPWLAASGERVVVMSRMLHPSRQREVPTYEAFYRARGYSVLHLEHTEHFEGMGDCIPHPGKRFLYGGWGHRSTAEAWGELAARLEVPILSLELPDPRFYHLDTCFLPLDESRVMLCEEAFTREGLAALERSFETLHAVPADEAARTFCLNAHTLRDERSGRRVALLHPGAERAKETLAEAGYEIVEVDTGEYLKSGGSVFCMKMMFY